MNSVLEGMINNLKTIKKEELPESKEKRSLREFEAIKAIEVSHKEALIPPRYRDKGFESFHPTSDRSKTNKEILEAYATHSANCVPEDTANFILMGTVGTGKTHLALSVLKRVLEKKSGAFVTLKNVLMSYKDFKGLGTISRDIINKDFLVIDEVNTSLSQLSDFDKESLFDVFNHRYNNLLPTMIISNLNPDQLLSALGKQVLSRLTEDGKNIIIFNDEDFRQKEQQ